MGGGGSGRERRLPHPGAAPGPRVWDISLRYFSDVPLRLEAGALDASLPPYVSDESTFFSAGRVVSDGETLRVTVTVPARRRIERRGSSGSERWQPRAWTTAVRLVPLASACGKYVDWYRISP